MSQSVEVLNHLNVNDMVIKRDTLAVTCPDLSALFKAASATFVWFMESEKTLVQKIRRHMETEKTFVQTIRRHMESEKTSKS